ncbi:MAG: cyclic peptide export ABC transporter [Leptolyngbyaceae cyanobacterium MO_188.B28]|nr:cyclic peptide export ABC transporter [Leptolyngbyaceae cyanobacterium MO_188.B28]
MTSFISILKQYQRICLLAVVAGILSGASFSGLVVTIVEAVETQLAQPYLSLLKFIPTWLGYGVFSIASSYYVSKLSQQLVFDLRIGLIEKILNTPLEQVEKMGARGFVVLTEDINTLANALEQFPSVLSALAIVIFCSFVYVATSPTLFLFIALIIGFFSLFYTRPLQKIRRHRQQVRQEWNQIFSYIHQLNQGIKELLLNSAKKHVFLHERFYPACQRQRQQTIRANVLENLTSRWGDLFLLLALGLAIAILPQLGYVSFQAIEKCLLIFLFASPSLKTALKFSSTFQNVRVSLKQIESLNLAIEPQSQPASLAPSTDNFEPIAKSLCLENIDYHYQNSENYFTLGPISLELSNTQITFITGGNGSGKSTLVKLLCGLYTPDTGVIKLNNQTVEQANCSAYRQRFSVLFSDGFLFKDLLTAKAPNCDLDLAKWNQYLHVLDLSRKVSILDGQFSTVNLSLGQQQRLSLLGALMEDHDIYIFDEWAANQDWHFKRFFYYQVLSDLKAKGKVVIVISHDESYYDAADRIIKLENGQIVSDTTAQICAL